jgi:excisionase family DNA binding protein
MDISGPSLMTVGQTAKQLGVHENTVRNWEKRGVLKAYRLPGSGHRRFDAYQVDQMKKEMLTQLAPATEGPIIATSFGSDFSIVHGDDLSE